MLEHNRHDLLSLAGVMAHALPLARTVPTPAATSAEQLALGRLYERAGDRARAIRVVRHGGARRSTADVRRHALARLAALLARDDRHDEAAAAWRGVLDLARGRARRSRRSTRRAVEALAIHHEHRARDLRRRASSRNS